MKSLRLSRYLILLWVCVAVGCIAPIAAHAQYDETFMGTPSLISGPRTVALASERVDFTIGSNVSARSQYVLRNNGAACTITVGFPDWQMENTPNRTLSVKVDKKAARLRVVRRTDGDGRDVLWHCFTQRFVRGQSCVLASSYTESVGGSLVDQGTIDSAGYRLHTGSSWQGAVGVSTIAVTFARKAPAPRLRPVAWPTLKVDSIESLDWGRQPRSMVIYPGSIKPVVVGRTLTFSRRNWNPKATDDLFLNFNFIPHRANH